jgi:hypothetical protein
VITQTIKQGENEIRIESAESIEDGEKHKFRIREGEYVRFFVNGKPVSSYMTLIKFMVDETIKNKERFKPDANYLMKMRKQLLQNQANDMKKQIESLKKQYEHQPASAQTIALLDGMIDRIDEYGVRVAE